MSDAARPGETVTLLFTDVEGSTDLRTRLGDEAADVVLGRHEAIVREEVEAQAGRIVKSLGDGFMIAFHSPRGALTCAAAVQQAVADRLEGITVRMGLNAGEVMERDGDLFGEAVNAAARIAAKSRGGQILLASVVKDLAGTVPAVSFVDRGLYWLKGFPERWRLWEAMWREDGRAGRPVAAQERTGFVGRESERADIRRLLDDALEGRGALVMIGGEPGVGKTRLAEEVAEEGEQRGMMALTGRCYDVEGAQPYLPFVEILETVARKVSRETLRGALGEQAGEVARIVPELRRVFPDLPPPLDLPPEQERRYLFNSVRDFLARAARMQPLLLVLDDLHWADEPTLLLVQHMAEELPELSVLVLGTYRDVELDVSRPLARTLEELIRRHLADRMSLKRFPEADVAEMLEGLAGRPAPPAVVKAVFAETEGNPLFVEEVFRHLHEEGRLLDETGEWRADLAIGELDVPESVRLVIGRRLERLSEDARACLATAAVIGRDFTFDLLTAVGDGDEEVLVDAIDEAERAHLVMSTAATGAARFGFAHELVRQTLLGGLSAIKRQRVHARVAEAMERVYASEMEEHAADLVHHLTQAGAAADPERMARLLLLAGDRAMKASAFEEALRHYENVSGLGVATEPGERAVLLEKLGRTRRSLGEWGAALPLWTEALDAYAEAGDAEAIGNLCWEVALQVGWTGRWQEAIEMCQRGLLALGEMVVPARSGLLGLGGVMAGFIGADQAGAEMIEEALELAKRLGDREMEGIALESRAIYHYGFAEHREVVEYGLQAADLLRDAGNIWHLVNILSIVEFSLFFLGRWDEAQRIAEEVEPIADRIGHAGAKMFTTRDQASREFITNPDLDRMERFALEDLELCRSADLPWTSQSYLWLCFLEFYRGRWDRALEYVEKSVEMERDLPGPFSFARNIEFGISAAAGRREHALAMLEERRSELGPLDEHTAWASLVFRPAVVEGLYLLGEKGRAAELYPVILDVIERSGSLYFGFVSPTMERLAGIAAAAGEDWEAAERHFENVLRLAEEVPNPIEGADVRRFWAMALLDRGGPGDAERAGEMLAAAIETYRRVGMPKHVEMAEGLPAKP